jgi:hypothetical protein
MHPAIRALYKELLLAARGYPGGMSAARVKLQSGFRANAGAEVTNGTERTALLDRGKFVLAELRALERLHKYRTMCKRYRSSTWRR